MDNWELNAWFDDFVEFIKSLPQSTVKIINPPRYRAMMESASELKNVLANEYEDGEISVQINEMFLIGAVSVALEDFSVSDMPRFIKALKAADCFDVFPLTNGKIRVELTFQGVLKSVR